MSDESTELASIDIGRILSILPHRYPFLLIDRIEQINGDEYGVGIKNVTVNEPFFAGHFPGRPIMPGVLIIEGMAQTAGAMCIHSKGADTPKLVYFMTIEQAKFRRPVVPGDRIEYRMTKLRQRGNVWKFAGEAWVDGFKVAEAEIGALVSDQ